MMYRIQPIAINTKEIHRGLVTHHQFQAITLQSLRIRNTMKSITGNPVSSIFI